MGSCACVGTVTVLASSCTFSTGPCGDNGGCIENSVAVDDIDDACCQEVKRWLAGETETPETPSCAAGKQYTNTVIGGGSTCTDYQCDMSDIDCPGGMSADRRSLSRVCTASFQNTTEYCCAFLHSDCYKEQTCDIDFESPGCNKYHCKVLHGIFDGPSSIILMM